MRAALRQASRRNLVFLSGGLAAALLVVVLLGPNASRDPDGLQQVAAQQGFADEAEEAPFELLGGYSVPGIDGAAASTALSGVIGVLAVAGITLGAAWALRRRSRTAAASVERT